MAVLQDLPPEIMAKIVRRLPDTGTQLKFGQTCHDIYEIAKPEMFRCIKVTIENRLSDGNNDTPDESAFNAVLKVLRHNCYVKQLEVHLEPTYYPGSRRAVVDPLLTLLRGFNPDLGGNINKLVLVLPQDYCIIHAGMPRAYFANGFHCRETFERLNEILKAVAVNQTITTLWICNLPPYDSPVYGTTPWQSFMARLARFKVSLLDDRAVEKENRASGKNPDIHELYDNLTPFTGAGLAQNFCSHMSSVESIEITNSSKSKTFGGRFFEDGGDRSHYNDFLQRLTLLSNKDLGTRSIVEEELAPTVAAE